jgi:hypothetical protein
LRRVGVPWSVCERPACRLAFNALIGNTGMRPKNWSVFHADDATASCVPKAIWHGGNRRRIPSTWSGQRFPVQVPETR